jgi:hypothetical protein
MNMEKWWNNVDRKPKDSEKNHPSDTFSTTNATELNSA